MPSAYGWTGIKNKDEGAYKFCDRSLDVHNAISCAVIAWVVER